MAMFYPMDYVTRRLVTLIHIIMSYHVEMTVIILYQINHIVLMIQFHHAKQLVTIMNVLNVQMEQD